MYFDWHDTSSVEVETRCWFSFDVHAYEQRLQWLAATELSSTLTNGCLYITRVGYSTGSPPVRSKSTLDSRDSAAEGSLRVKSQALTLMKEARQVTGSTQEDTVLLCFFVFNLTT